jgi:hypothetical protein
MNRMTLPFLAASTLGLGILGALLPPVTVNAQPNAATEYCSISEQDPSGGGNYGGYADKPMKQRKDHKDAINATFHVVCKEPVTVFIDWSINGPQNYFYGTNPVSVVAPFGQTCTLTNPCGAQYPSPIQKISGSFTGHDLYQAAGLARVYPANTYCECGATPLQVFNIKGASAIL